MNGVSRFLSRRDKHNEKRASKHDRSKLSCADVTLSYVQLSTIDSSDYLILQSRQSETNLYAIFTNEELKVSEKDGEKKVKNILQRLQTAGITTLGEAQAQYALSWYPDDLDKAYDLLLLANDSFEGILKDYDTNVHMQGAVNRNMVTCYLDALLFAMFAMLDSFEAMLFDNFTDQPRKKLAGVLRLWVNLLRTGQLIQVDLTKRLQDSLSKCGWEEAAEVSQQDASEAFTFITGALELPLLTLKMDIYHTGREDKEDDHKFVNERLLEVAIPEQEEGNAVTLEDCLEEYFNNRIEVKRYLQRQNTLTSLRPAESDREKGHSLHIETLEMSGAESPMVESPTSITPGSPIRPSLGPIIEGRRRADSIFTERATLRGRAAEVKHFDEKKMLDEMLNTSSSGRPWASSFRKEVMMPAWQFFSLIPWYTDNVPKSDAQVAAHFSAKRPVLGICLKRYTMLANGSPKRLDTYIDIPLEIGLPHFISDDRMKEEGPLFGNFKLVLQSVVCHRGVSVDSGHYISLVRANHPHRNQPSTSPMSQDDLVEDSWLRFDDLATPRVCEVDIKQALKEESPYLLFYQVQPIDEKLASRGDPPTYDETLSGLPTADPSRETLATDAESGTDWEKVPATDLKNLESGNSDGPTGRSSMSSNRQSTITFEELENSIQCLPGGRTHPPTPDDQKSGFLSTSRRDSRTWIGGSSKSRPTSQSGEGRLSLTISRLAGRGSKDKLRSIDTGNTGNTDDPVIIINEARSTENGGQGSEHAVMKDKHKDSGFGYAKSKRGKEKKEDKKRSKSRDPAEHLDKRKGKNRPDRECLVM
ncbi:ubiquitin C-terminal hydrolase family protein [Pleomassaria siparia CBS 279.74]|uniref:ubiquitinyl hydrolase 1 n=1 Tax=Pleomassaria siparia CBS 279.74 TaxID=1314801 RepID=A0A6G1KRF8_9PLEO|nr:ubiquitin C-terminal hydrolase family protein [Pleomassaria siparia CBS 279.74]